MLILYFKNLLFLFLQVVLQNRRKFTIDYRIQSAAHNRLYHRLLQLKCLKAMSYRVFIHYALSIIKQYIFTFNHLHIYLVRVSELLRPVQKSY